MKRTILLFALLLTMACHCRRQACGKVTTKVWSHVTGACYVIVQDLDNPSDALYLTCDTLEWPAIEIGQLYCGRVMDMN